MESGNVAEWTRECSSALADGGCKNHVLRGGSIDRTADPKGCGYAEPPDRQRANGGDIIAGVRCCADSL